MVDRALNDADFLERVQSDFNVEDMTESRLREWLYHGESGEHQVSKGKRNEEQRLETKMGEPLTPQTKRLAEKLSIASEIYEKILKLEIKIGKRLKYTDEQKSFILSNQDLSVSELANRFNSEFNNPDSLEIIVNLREEISDSYTHRESLLKLLDEKIKLIRVPQRTQNAIRDKRLRLLGKKK